MWYICTTFVDQSASLHFNVLVAGASPGESGVVELTDALVGLAEAPPEI